MPIEKLMMSRPSALSCLAFSATTMIALGLARPMRSASLGLAEPRAFGEREAAGGRVAVTRARASQPRDFSMPAAPPRPSGAGAAGTPRHRKVGGLAQEVVVQ